MMECFRIVDEQRPRLSNNEHCSSFINPKWKSRTDPEEPLESENATVCFLVVRLSLCEKRFNAHLSAMESWKSQPSWSNSSTRLPEHKVIGYEMPCEANDVPAAHDAAWRPGTTSSGCRRSTRFRIRDAIQANARVARAAEEFVRSIDNGAEAAVH